MENVSLTPQAQKPGFLKPSDSHLSRNQQNLTPQNPHLHSLICSRYHLDHLSNYPYSRLLSPVDPP